jgi:hypothetical protein
MTKMERVHQLLAAGTLEAEDGNFWIRHWHYIASAKVPLETKVTAYRTLKLRGVAHIKDIDTLALYDMLRADRAFVAALDLDAKTAYYCRVCLMWIDDDVAAYSDLQSRGVEGELMQGRPYWANYSTHVLVQINAPRCIRYVLQDKASRELILRYRMTPLTQRLVEELVQPTDQLNRWSLLSYGQSVKLIGMCVKDEDLVEAWLQVLRAYTIPSRACVSVEFARKVYALATPDQSTAIKIEVSRSILYDEQDEDCFELAWLFGLVGPFEPKIQGRFLKKHVNAFPAFTFAMIVAMCDGYLKRTRKITAPQKRFFAFVTRLPMDLQALISLRLWGHTATVISTEKFDRAFLVVI